MNDRFDRKRGHTDPLLITLLQRADPTIRHTTPVQRKIELRPRDLTEKASVLGAQVESARLQYLELLTARDEFAAELYDEHGFSYRELRELFGGRGAYTRQACKLMVERGRRGISERRRMELAGWEHLTRADIAEERAIVNESHDPYGPPPVTPGTPDPN